VLRTWQAQQWEEQVDARLKPVAVASRTDLLSLRRGQPFMIERGQTPGERIDKRIEDVIVQRAVHQP